MAQLPTLLAFDHRFVPEHLRLQKRWVLWIAKWIEKRRKYDKVPVFARPPHHGLSTNEPQHWLSYDDALSAYLVSTPGTFAGLGYVMTHVHGVVGVDLDHCVVDGVVQDWALVIVRTINSYTELSPSGNGLRIFALSDMIDGDFSNHEVGIEGYVGTSARFLTITGQHLPGTPPELQIVPEETMAALRRQYAPKRVKVNAAPMPDIEDELLIQDWRDYSLQSNVTDFLESGTATDRSAMVQRAARLLFAEGLDAPDVFNILIHNEHAMAVALDHRRQSYDRALDYVWAEHCLKPEAKQMARVAEFEALDPAIETVAAPEIIAAPMFEPLPPEPKTANMFQLTTVQDFLHRHPPKWLIKKVLPQAALGVLFGESGSGKSFAALDMAMATARGIDWRGRKVKRCRVAYIAAEGVGGFRNRVDAYTRANNLDPQEFRDWFRIIERAPNMMEKKDALELAKALLAWGHVGLVVVDTWAQVTPGANENAGDDMGKALGHCKGLHTATRAMILLIHHSGKDQSRGARGWSGLKAAADVEMEVVHNAGARVLEITKQKDGESGMRFGFVLAKVPLGMDEDGEVFDSCVVQFSAVSEALAPQAIKNPLEGLGPYGVCVMQVLEDFQRDQSTGIEIKAIKEEALRRMPRGDLNTDSRKDQIARAIRKLVKNNVFGVEAGVVVDPE